MTKSISNSPVMNGYPRGKQERVHSKKISKITWKTHDYVIQSKNSSCFSFCGSNIHLDTPLTDRVTFEKNIQAIIEDISLEKGSHRGERLSDIKLKTLKENALRATTIPKRISEAFEKYDYDFLKPFLNCYNPQKFSKKYFSLNSKEQKLFKKIIGGNNALKIIQDTDFKERLKTLLKVVKLIKRVENTRIPIDKNIDEFIKKIQTLEEKQIRDAFRYFGSEKMFGKKDFIFLNNESLELPDLSSIEDEGEAFLEWLCEEITSKVTDDKELIDFILPSLSFNIFRLAHYSTLREKFPGFFETRMDLPRLKQDSSNPTHFFINKIDEKIYEVAQAKNYILRVHPSDDNAELFDIGNLNVCLKIQFNSKREIISLELYIKDIVFFDNVDLQTQIKVLKELDISKKV